MRSRAALTGAVKVTVASLPRAPPLMAVTRASGAPARTSPHISVVGSTYELASGGA